jgi:hypothetical protein
MTNQHDTITADPDNLATRWAHWETESLPLGLLKSFEVNGLFTTDAFDTAHRLGTELDERLGRHGARRAVDGFIADGDGWHDRCDRWVLLRLMEKLTATSLTKVPLPRPEWAAPTGLRARTLSDLEHGVVRVCAIASAHFASTIAICEAGTASRELALILPDMLDGDLQHGFTGVHLPGTTLDTGRIYRPLAARRNDLPAWGRRHVADQRSTIFDNSPLLYRGKKLEAEKRQSSVLANIHSVLTDAGLGTDPTVKPLSIRNTAARALYLQTNRIEDVARFVGTDRWDALKAEIGLCERAPVRAR